jgi:hypothetical protein
LEGVIPNLFRFYIHMGDLYRYAEAYNKAETCYLNAAKIAPGKGNPYNQLAVVAQMKDANMSCLALYWYARSLLATHQSFETSTGNLDRLFIVNKDYLNEHSRDKNPPILSMENKKKMSSDLIRAQKAAASKSCLAHFVDVHYELFKKKDVDAAEKESAIRAKMGGVMDSLESLCRVSAFGDALLCKIVTINTFTFEVTKKDKNPLNHQLSREFLFVLGSSLATRLEATMSKLLEKEKIAAPSIRLLLPFQIICEFIDNLENMKGKQEDSFWKRFAAVANLSLNISKKLGVSASSFALEKDVNVPLKEYQALQGYRPFSFLFESYATGEPFIGPDEAIEVLELTLSQSQESTANNSGEENKSKLSRFLEICSKFVEKASIPISHNDSGYSFVDDDTKNNEMTVDRKSKNAAEGAVSMNVDSPQDSSFPVEMQSPDVDVDEAGDMVVYKAPEEGDGPALLVPGAFLKSATKSAEKSPAAAPTPKEDVTTSSERTQIPTSRHVLPAVPPPPGMLPPPGFTAPVAQDSPLRASPVIQQGTPPQGFYGHIIPGHPRVYPALPNPPYYGAFPGFVPLQEVPPPLGGSLPIDPAWQVLGGPEKLQTSNPFARPPPVAYGQAKAAQSLFEEQPITTEGTLLLDSALIDSLFMNDTNTSNPWK